MERQLSEYFAEVEIAPQFRAFVPAALLRLQVLYPSLEFSSDAALVTVSALNGFEYTEIRKSVLHAIYREKIYTETLPMRRQLVAAVTGK